MTTNAVVDSAAETVPVRPLDRAAGVDLLGPLEGSGYRAGVSLVRRADGQMVQLGPLMYALLEAVDGRQDGDELAANLTRSTGRRFEPAHVERLAEKLGQQGLLAGTEQFAPPRRNPLLALRWKVLVTNPAVTQRLVAPFSPLFARWIMGPSLVFFGYVCWFVLIHKGVASATSQAFNNPALLLLVFALAAVSAGFHELGHAAACRYGGATPGGMGMGIYLVWPAFYTDVTDAYRLPRRDRLRIDLAGLYFNALVADATLLVWFFWRLDALLLVVAVQVLQMVKQLSPVIRADGYHILSDATGVPDLFAHMGPTLRRLIPGRRREPSALSGWARALVTAWVLIVVPVLASLIVGAIMLLPHLATNAWDTGRAIIRSIPHQLWSGQIVNVLASLLRLVALGLPVIGSTLIALRILRSALRRADRWSSGHPVRRRGLMAVSALIVAALVWVWWPSGQYQPVRADERGTLGQLFSAHPGSSAGGGVAITPGTHLAMAMIPVGGASRSHPALFFLPGAHNQRPTAILSTGGKTSAAFPFTLPAGPRPGDTQALAVNTTDGGVVYKVAYSLVTVTGGAPVGQANTAYALADCKACTTVAVSFQLILVVGQSNTIAPIDAAGALNYQCPACATTAIADQMVVTLKSQPSAELTQQLTAALSRLNAVSQLGADGTPDAVISLVTSVQDQIAAELAASGLLTDPPQTSSTLDGSPPSSTSTTETTVPTSGTSSSSDTTDTTDGTATSATTAPTDTSTTDSSTTMTTTTSTSSPTSRPTTGASTTTDPPTTTAP